MNCLHITWIRYLSLSSIILAMLFWGAACDKAPHSAMKQTSVKICGGLYDPGPMALDRMGNICLIDRMHGRIEVIMADGTKTTLAVRLDQPGDLVVDHKGRILVSETGTGKILCIHLNGTSTVVADGLDGPTGLTIDRDGGIYVSCGGNGQVMKITRIGEPHPAACDWQKKEWGLKAL